MEYVLKTENLTKTYSKQEVLKNVNMSVPKGSIYGFIGENGAGKSTTMKIITGLSRKTKGSFEILGNKNAEVSRKEIGSIIESPSLYLDLSARDNLEIHRRMKGLKDKNRIDKVLSLVNLKDTKKKAKNFSLGMKQRLGLAIGLLAKPKLLLLDEPTNGLDPMGVIELRDTFKKLNEEGITIIISTHILSELEIIATHFGFISGGKILEEISSEELKKKTDNLEDYYIKLIRGTR